MVSLPAELLMADDPAHTDKLWAPQPVATTIALLDPPKLADLAHFHESTVLTLRMSLRLIGFDNLTPDELALHPGRQALGDTDDVTGSAPTLGAATETTLTTRKLPVDDAKLARRLDHIVALEVRWNKAYANCSLATYPPVCPQFEVEELVLPTTVLPRDSQLNPLRFVDIDRILGYQRQYHNTNLHYHQVSDAAGGFPEAPAWLLDVLDVLDDVEPDWQLDFAAEQASETPQKHTFMLESDGMVVVSATDRFYVVRATSEDLVAYARDNQCWTLTGAANRELQTAYTDAKALGVRVFLFFALQNMFCGVAEMVSPVDPKRQIPAFSPQFPGMFNIKWHLVLEVSHMWMEKVKNPLHHNRPVTKARDGTKVAYEAAVEMLQRF